MKSGPKTAVMACAIDEKLGTCQTLPGRPIN